MLRATLLLVSFWLVLTWSALRYGGVLAADWNYTVLGLAAILVLGYLPLRGASLSAPPDWKLYCCMAAIPSWAALQLVPLPLGLLDLLSPARATLARSLAFLGDSGPLTPLSLRPEATRLELLHLLGYAATFLIARDLMWRLPRGQWRMAAPLLVVGVLEATLGLVQDAVNPNTVFPSGTFVNRDHFSSFLEMGLPLAAGGAVEYWSRPRRRPFLACLLAAGGTVMLAAIAASLSRGGFLIALFTLSVLGAIQIRHRFRGVRRAIGLAGGAVLLVGATVVLATPALLVRFAGSDGISGITQENRWRFWSETLQVIARYPITGCGFGAFVSGVAAFRRAVPTRTLDYAHNVPLHFLAEGGVIALLPALAGMVLLLRRLRQAWPTGPRRAELPLACALALFAGFAHSLFDFNLSIPACAMAFSWLAGMAAGLRFSPPIPTHRPLTLTTELLDQFRR